MTAPAQPREAAAVEALVVQQAAAQAQITDRTLVLLAALWAAISDFRDPDQLQSFAARAVAAIRRAELSTGSLTETFLRRVLRTLGVTVPARQRLVVMPDSLRYGVPLEEVVLRPAATVRFLRSEDAPEEAAREAGRARLEVVGQTQVQLAMREAARQTYEKVPAVRGFRRVIRPYLSESGSCGLCIAASDRVYGKRELLPIHDKCKCTTLPILSRGGLSDDEIRRIADPDQKLTDEDLRRIYGAGGDPGLRLNEEDLRRLYAQAGGTAGAKLKRTRYRVEQHGELGPVLVPQGRAFRTAADAGESVLGSGAKTRRSPDERGRSQRAQLTTLEASIESLQRRAARGEDVTAALTWQQSRVDELRRLVRGARAA